MTHPSCHRLAPAHTWKFLEKMYQWKDFSESILVISICWIKLDSLTISTAWWRKNSKKHVAKELFSPAKVVCADVSLAPQKSIYPSKIHGWFSRLEKACTQRKADEQNLQFGFWTKKIFITMKLQRTCKENTEAKAKDSFLRRWFLDHLHRYLTKHLSLRRKDTTRDVSTRQSTSSLHRFHQN